MQRVQQAQAVMEERLGADGMRRLLIYLCIVGLLIVSGPFGTISDLSLWERTVYWTMAIGAGFVGGEAYHRFARPILLRHRLRTLATVLSLVAISASALATVLLLETVFRQPVPLPFMFALFLSVSGVSVAVWGIVQLGTPRSSDLPNVHSREFAAFQERWPADLKAAELCAMAAEDHFVRIYTSRGEALLSGKFSEALKAVQDIHGAQVHRSWWVADRSVARLDRTAGKWKLIVVDGPEVPVSRKFRPEVRAWRWDTRDQG